MRTMLCICMLLALASCPTDKPQRYHCFMKTDGSVYCYAADGHLFRPRFNSFVLEVRP